jgi:pimeloyl-ACP methyl ester carboxylesterase
MQNLGYTHYIAQGGDWGSMISRLIALQYPDACVGCHINFIYTQPPSALRHPLEYLYVLLGWFTPEEKKRFARLQWFLKYEFGYTHIQQTKPQTLSYGLLDSPIGMLAWIMDKLHIAVEPDFMWDNEVVITWAMLYLIAGSAGHARIYKEAATTLTEELYSKRISSKVPFGFSAFPFDVGYVPQWWARATVAENIVFWKNHEKGGHFPSCERPAELEDDIQEFVRILREKGSSAKWEAALKAGVDGRY